LEISPSTQITPKWLLNNKRTEPLSSVTVKIVRGMSMFIVSGLGI